MNQQLWVCPLWAWLGRGVGGGLGPRCSDVWGAFCCLTWSNRPRGVRGSGPARPSRPSGSLWFRAGLSAGPVAAPRDPRPPSVPRGESCPEQLAATVPWLVSTVDVSVDFPFFQRRRKIPTARFTPNVISTYLGTIGRLGELILMLENLIKWHFHAMGPLKYRTERDNNFTQTGKSQSILATCHRLELDWSTQWKHLHLFSIIIKNNIMMLVFLQACIFLFLYFGNVHGRFPWQKNVLCCILRERKDREAGNR